MHRPSRCASLLLLPGIVLAVGCAVPQPPRLTPPDPALSEAEIEERVAFIEERLDASRRHGFWWNTGWWIADGVGVALGTVGAVTADDGSERASGIVTAVLGLGGFAYQQLMPMRIRHGADPLREMPDATHADKLAKLGKAQELLAYDAERATVAINWQAHLANALVAAAAAGIVAAAGSDRTGPVLFMGLSTLIGGEVQFWTEPQRPRRDIEDYVERFEPQDRTTRSLHLAPTSSGLALRFDF